MTGTVGLACRRTVVTTIIALSVVVGQANAWAAPKGPKPTPAPGDSIPPTAPTGLRVTGTTKTSVSLAWSPSTDNSGTFSYVVKQDHLSWTVPDGQTSYTLTWLSPGRTYSFYVYAVDRALNTSGNSNTVTATTLPDLTPPSAPALSVPAVSPSQIWLTWTEAVDDMPYAGVGYGIYVNGAPATSINWINHREASLRHLSPATTYSVLVRARDASGNTSDSDVVTVTTPASTDTVPPSAPTDLRIEIDQGCAEVWLAWTQSTDNVDPQSAIEYEVYVNGVLSPLAVVTGVGRSFAYGTNFGVNTFVVKAVDRTGNTSAASNSISAELWPC
jgi:chitodextrinase